MRVFSRELALVEDDRDLGQGVASLLRDRGYRVVWLEDVGAVRGWLKNAGSLELLLVDLHLPDGSGIDVVRAATDRGLLSLLWTVDGRREVVTEGLRAGARGYVLKDSPVDALVLAIESVLSGGTWLSSSVCRSLVGTPEARSELTKREREVVIALSRGLTYSEAAEVLSLSVGTLQTYVKRIYTKLDVSSKAELAALSVRCGWVDVD